VDAITIRDIHPIEATSYQIMRSKVDTTHLLPRSRDVAERIVHTTADVGWLEDLVLDESALSRGATALWRQAPLIVDVTMVKAGITRYPSICTVAESETAEFAKQHGLTRSAAAIRLAAAEHPSGAVWAVGNAPTALFELIRLRENGEINPALVIGLPVGFVGAAESKEALRHSDLPQLSNVSARGGSAVAAAAVNALLYGNPLEDAS
jgi:precorrin-8X/cobalt-precorrin-8 methylmutase